ncbi:AraC family transcriptional regulator [Methylobacterium nonmethylotrophicum]|uniref:AraC family transcriptional regulator n=1 Tax=Methylobacterium nonmethylotrophicum TaxID=1141884 RepID=A0A4Z0NF55_9HYPH|nr:AraC family transcriptional regulator [Methylobacterium nonmethylotrophicum]TGD93177.1 AraC family transcriptional regulator [Methylobacterium nonmethylotrophicum]
MREERHRARQHRTGLPGLEAVAVSSDRSFPRHAHDQYGIGVVLAGGHRSWSGVGAVEAAAGDVITVNPGEIHDGLPIQARIRAWQMLYLDPALLAGLLREDLPRAGEIARPALHDPVLAGRFTRLFAGIAAARPDAFAVEQDLVGVLMHLFARYGGGPAPRRGPPPFVARALRRLEEAPGEAVTLAELAGLSGVSRFQLIRGFARATGATPHAYLVQQRVRLARRLLAEGRWPAAAAAEAGFADQSHMTRAFVRQFGVTPARFRAALA